MNKYLFLSNRLAKQLAFTVAFLLSSICIADDVSTSTNSSVNVPDRLIVGYWHNWADGLGYALGNSPKIELKDIDSRYNAIMISFMKVHPGQNSRIPTFKLNSSLGISEQQFIEQIKLLQSQGRLVLISLGGANAHIELQKSDVNDLANEIIRLTDRYGFNGLDIDLEFSAIIASENQTVIPEALKLVKQHYSKQNKYFVISMAPEFPYLRIGGNYVPYLEALEGFYDWIAPQFYNQGLDGIYIDDFGYIAQNNPELKQKFIYHISKAIINGTGYYKIPHDKLVFGLPANKDAADNGYVENPNDLIKAFNKLAKEETPLRGIMTWSINWDVGSDVYGGSYNSAFINSYGNYFHKKITYDKHPVIIGADAITLPPSSDFDPVSDVIATDKEDGDLTKSIKISGHLDLNKIGDYELTYTVTDSAYNTTTIKRKVSIVSENPRITGADDITLKLGDTFDPYAGVKVLNSEDEDITKNLVVRGKVNTELSVTTYDLIYRATDDFENSVEKIRRVKVVADIDDIITRGSVTNIEEFNPKSQYTAGNKVKYKGKIYVAERWTDIGSSPDTSYAGWKLFIGSI